MNQYHKIHIPAHVIAKWGDMTERNDHSTVLWEIACFFSYAEYKYQEFEKLADVFAWVIRERDKHGYIPESAYEERRAAYYKLRDLITAGYGPETFREIPC